MFCVLFACSQLLWRAGNVPGCYATYACTALWDYRERGQCGSILVKWHGQQLWQ